MLEIFSPQKKYFTTTINHCLTPKVYNRSYLINYQSVLVLHDLVNVLLWNIEISERSFNVGSDVDLLKFMILMILMLCLLPVIGTLMIYRLIQTYKLTETIHINLKLWQNLCDLTLLLNTNCR